MLFSEYTIGMTLRMNDLLRVMSNVTVTRLRGFAAGTEGDGPLASRMAKVSIILFGDRL
jgi:hypothetical protein